jgi:hypothetical protein
MPIRSKPSRASQWIARRASSTAWRHTSSVRTMFELTM